MSKVEPRWSCTPQINCLTYLTARVPGCSREEVCVIMSRQEHISLGQASAAEWTPDDLTFQIHVRLCRDGALKVEANELSSKPSSAPPPADLCRLAYGIYSARRKRDKMLGTDLFGEPAWDMMLALYCLPPRGEKISVTSLSYAANVAVATGHRVQAALEMHGLIERQREGSDRRIQLVSLTAQGRLLLERYLAWLSGSSRVGNCYLGQAAA